MIRELENLNYYQMPAPKIHGINMIPMARKLVVDESEVEDLSSE